MSFNGWFYLHIYFLFDIIILYRLKRVQYEKQNIR
jgi:hypothetical protein